VFRCNSLLHDVVAYLDSVDVQAIQTGAVWNASEITRQQLIQFASITPTTQALSSKLRQWFVEQPRQFSALSVYALLPGWRHRYNLVSKPT